MGMIGNSPALGIVTPAQLSDAELQSLAAMSPSRATYLAGTEGFGFRNRIINGDMRIDQRNAGASVTPTGGQYAIDRWRSESSSGTGGAYSIQRSAVAPTGFSNSALMTVTTADTSIASTDYYDFQQFIEGFNVADLGWGTASAQTITISFWVRSSVTGTFAGSVGNGAANRSYVFTYTVNAANTFEYKTVTIPGDTAGTWLTDNGRGLCLTFDLGNGSSYQASAGSWVGQYAVGTASSVKLISTSGATFYITGVQLEAGTVATPFERRDYGRELLMCQRYFAKTYPQSVVPGASGAGGLGALFTPNPVTNSYPILGTWRFPAAMRATPSIVLYNPSTGATGGFLGDSTNFGSAGVGSVGESGASFFGSNVSVSTSVFMSVHATASAEL